MIYIDENNLANVVLNMNSAGKNQFIYFSQLYQTTFAVYANFTITTSGKIETIELKIVNYKGTIDLGFHDKFTPVCSFHEQENASTGEKDYILRIEFEVKAVVGGETKDWVYVELDQDLNDRYTNIPPNKNVFLFVERKVAPMWGDDREGKPIVLHQGVFDQEFFYRDGIRYERREITEVPEDLYTGNTNRVYEDVDIFHAPGFKCRNSTLLVLQD